MNTGIGPKAMSAKPSALIRSDYNKFSELCHQAGEPIMVTRNGQDDLVVMSPETYNRMIDKLQLMADLMEADRELQSGAPTIPAADVFAGLRSMIHEHMQD